MYQNKIVKDALICLLLAFLVSCSTKKNTFLNRAYHNTTAHFNVYFNGQEALKEVVQTLEKDHKDNYDKVLPIFKIGTSEQAKSIYPAADKAIAKASKTVQKHSMNIGGKERVKWIKYAYLMVGQANFYKYDYMPALEMFQFVFKQYDKSKIKYDALFWLSRAYNERGSYNESQNMIDLVESEFPKVKKKKRWQHYAVTSDLLIKQELYGQAIPNVLKTIKALKNRKTQTRLKFILAQLYERVGDKVNSTKYYNEVLRRNSPFEMEFNTRINRALVYDNHSGASGGIKKELKKLGRDDKYIEFQDKIFYALGSIEEEEGNKAEAIKYYKKSVAASTSNVNQKGKSFLKLADIAFKDAQYELASVYFDSTVSFLLPADEKFVYASMKKELLNELVANIKTIKTEDSLQKIGTMSPNEQEAYIDALIEKRRADDEAKKEAEALKQQMQQTAANNAMASSGNNIPQIGAAAVWYFYNPNALSFGLADFTKKFGNRKLEDNWRRSNKQAISKDVFSENDAANSSTDSIPAEYTRDFYLKGVPTKPSDFVTSNQKIIDAYFSLGIIYREQLNENNLAAKNLEELLKRFPENKYKLTSYYQLYKIFSDLANTSKADYYKNKVCTEAPQSDYCKIILNPSIGSTLKNDKQKMEAMYEATYNAFLNLNYDSVITVANEVDRLYSGDATQPKFNFLRALSIGRSATVPEFEASLKDVVMRFPKHKVKDEAKAILEFIAKLTGEEEEYKKKNPDAPALPLPPSLTPKDTSKQGQITPLPNLPLGTAKQDSVKTAIVAPSIYTYAPDSGHYCMIVLINKGNESNKVKSSISDFNAKYFSLEEITITSVQVGQYTSILVAGFEKPSRALDYNLTLKQKPESIASHQPLDYKLFAISENNFGKLIKTGNLDAYVNFFEEKYTKK